MKSHSPGGAKPSRRPKLFHLSDIDSQILRLFGPVLVEQGLATLTTMLGTMLVSGVGAYAVSGVGLVDSINFLVMNVFTAIANGVTVVVSQYVGRRALQDAGRVSVQSIVVCVEGSAVMGVLLCLLGRPLLGALFSGAEPDVLEAAHTFLIFSSLSMPLQALYATVSGIMRATGNSRTPMMASFFANVVYVTVSFCCINFLHLGIAGVGLGLTLSRATSSGTVLLLLKRSVHHLFSLPKFSPRPDLKILKPVLHIAIPAGADSALFNGGKVIVQMFMSGMGTASLAANSIISSLSGFLNLPGNAMSIVSMTIIGQTYGAGKIRETRRQMVRLTLASCLSLGLTSLMMFLLLDPMLGLYQPTAESAVLVRQVMNFLFLTQFAFWAPAFVTPNQLRATGDVTFPMWVSVISMFVVRVAGSWFFGVYLDWGLFGIWFSMVADWVVRLSFYAPRAFLGHWCKDFKARIASEEDS